MALDDTQIEKEIQIDKMENLWNENKRIIVVVVAVIISIYIGLQFYQYSAKKTGEMASQLYQEIITLNIDEGERYEFGDIKLYGNSVIDPEIIKSNLTEVILPKQTFSRQRLQESEELLAYLLGDEGFAFPEIIGLPVIDDVTKIVDIEFRIDPGQRSTVIRINITGIHNTNDEVYRRELRQFESSLHNNRNIESNMNCNRNCNSNS